MIPRERLKPIIGAGVVVAAGLTWVLAFRTGLASNADWNEEWNGPTDLRGKTVWIANRKVETTAEREKRLAKVKVIDGEFGSMKKAVLGNNRKIRGDDIEPESPDLPEGFDYNPREACIQMKMEFPERYGKVDCMSDRFDGSDPWWKVDIHGN